MKLLNKFNKGRGDENDDALDLEDDLGPDPEDPDEGGNPTSGGLFGKLLGRLKPGGGDTEDIDDAVDMDDTEDNALDTGEDSSVQVVRLEGVPDVHPVGESEEALVPPGVQAGKDGGNRSAGSAPSPSIGQGSASPAAGTSTQASPDENLQAQVPAPDESPQDQVPVSVEYGDDSDSEGLDFSLKDIFEEEAAVDEHLKDLADSQEDIRADDLANELREFLSELET